MFEVDSDPTTLRVVPASLLLSPISRLFRYMNRGKAVILVYHRIKNSESFERQISFLTRYYRVVDVDTIVSALRDRRPLASYCAAVTFDDGYRSLCKQAYPVLQRYGCPATIFMNTGLATNGKPAWWFWVRRFVLHANVPVLELRIGGEAMSFPLNDSQSIMKAYRTVVRRFERDWHYDLARNLNLLWEAAGKPEPQWDDDDLSLTWEQARAMEASGLIRFGNHTDTHRTLPYLDDATLMAEIDKAEMALRAHLSRPSRVFAYPAGVRDARAVTHLSQLKYLGAVTTEQRPVSLTSDPMNCERIGASDEISLSSFRLRISGARSVARSLVRRVAL